MSATPRTDKVADFVVVLPTFRLRMRSSHVPTALAEELETDLIRTRIVLAALLQRMESLKGPGLVPRQGFRFPDARDRNAMRDAENLLKS